MNIEMPMTNEHTHSFPDAGFQAHTPENRTEAPWAGRRMYASDTPGAKGESADESERGHRLGIAETAVWSSFMNRIIKSK